ncbi:hypothetical protein PGW91_05305 [Fusobacterium nucleatum]|nr:hypothetical protein [Fusobacterium nucleatum]WCB33602.1 hypothetical protein PGW91_05305 [Fusobacterium nucleatum]
MEELFNKELLDFLKKNCKEKDIDISEWLYKGLHCTKILEKNELNLIKKNSESWLCEEKEVIKEFLIILKSYSPEKYLAENLVFFRNLRFPLPNKDEENDRTVDILILSKKNPNLDEIKDLLEIDISDLINYIYNKN